LDNLFFFLKKKENKAGLACGLACLIFFNVTGWMTHHPLFNFISKKNNVSSGGLESNDWRVTRKSWQGYFIHKKSFLTFFSSKNTIRILINQSLNPKHFQIGQKTENQAKNFFLFSTVIYFIYKNSLNGTSELINTCFCR